MNEKIGSWSTLASNPGFAAGFTAACALHRSLPCILLPLVLQLLVRSIDPCHASLRSFPTKGTKLQK
jgi:hypothetical protein